VRSAVGAQMGFIDTDHHIEWNHLLFEPSRMSNAVARLPGSLKIPTSQVGVAESLVTLR
jgi:hypothetical protein